MARNRLGNLGGGIVIPVVLPTVTNKQATVGFELSDEVFALHRSVSSASLRTPEFRRWSGQGTDREGGLSPLGLYHRIAARSSISSTEVNSKKALKGRSPLGYSILMRDLVPSSHLRGVAERAERVRKPRG